MARKRRRRQENCWACKRPVIDERGMGSGRDMTERRKYTGNVKKTAFFIEESKKRLCFLSLHSFGVSV